MDLFKELYVSALFILIVCSDSAVCVYHNCFRDYLHFTTDYLLKRVYCDGNCECRSFKLCATEKDSAVCVYHNCFRDYLHFTTDYLLKRVYCDGNCECRSFKLCATEKGSYSSQLYLQPQQTQHGYFTNDSFFITCFTTDDNIDQLRWSDFESNTIDSTDGRIHIQPADGAQQGLRLVFTSVEKEDAGIYTCSDVQDSTSFELIVSRSISFSDTPKVQHAPEGENGVVLCNIRSDAHPVVTWYFKGRQIKKSPKYQILENHSLKIYNLSRTDAGDYKCKAILITSLSTQMKDFDIKLHVQYSPEIIGEQRKNFYAKMGTEIQLPCTVTAEPDPMFQWLRDEMIIYNNTKGYTIFNTHNSSALQFDFETEDQLGEYICRANNALGQDEVIVVLKEGGPPHPPTVSVKSEDNGVLTLSIEPKADNEKEEELKTSGFRVQYKLSSESWDMANTQDFKIGESFLLKNVSFNSEYVIRAAGHNFAGYGEYSEDVVYKTHSIQTASVVASASGIVASSLVLFTSIVFFRLF